MSPERLEASEVVLSAGGNRTGGEQDTDGSTVAVRDVFVRRRGDRGWWYLQRHYLGFTYLLNRQQTYIHPHKDHG